jgi:hypothetical protein
VSLDTDGGKLRDHSLLSGAGYLLEFRGLKPFFYPVFKNEKEKNFSLVIYEQSVDNVI